MIKENLKVSKRRGRNSQQMTYESELKLETRVFDLCHGRYSNLTELAKVMGISISQVYRVRQGTRPISEKFITGTVKAFPEYRLDDLFLVVPNGKQHGKK